MNPTMLTKIVSLVPERMARVPSGTLFAWQDSPESAGSQVAALGRLLHWLTPLSILNEEEQRALGLLSLHGKSGRRDDEDEADDEREEASLPG